MSHVQAIDLLFLALALGLPVPLIWRYGLRGVIVGALLNWILLAAVGPILSALDPTRDAAVLDSVWLYLGWIASILFCLFLHAVMTILRRCRTVITATIGDNK